MTAKERRDKERKSAGTELSMKDIIMKAEVRRWGKPTELINL
jgi:hypothetical protein